MSAPPATPARLWRGLHLLALVALAVAQPLYSVLASGADFFVAWGLGFAGAAFVAVALLVVPTLALALAVEAAFAVGPRSGRVALGGVVALLGAATAIAPLVRAEVHAAFAVPLAAGLGLLLAFFYLRAPLLRSAVSAFSFAPAVMLLLFLASPGIRRLGVAAAAPPETPAGSEDPATASRPGIVVVVFDELPLASLLDADLGIDARRLPGFARLAATSTWYRQATTVADVTTRAIPAILTGTVPFDQRPATASAHPRNLFSLFGVPGRTNIRETLTRVCPDDLCAESLTRFQSLSGLPEFSADLVTVYAHVLTPPPLNIRLPTLSGAWQGFAGRAPGAGPGRHDPAGTFRDFLDHLPRNHRGTLSFVHVNLPHIPFQYLPSGRRYGPTSEPVTPHGLRKANWSDDPHESEQALQRHLLQVGFVDLLVSELLDRLAGLESLDESILVVTADHGVGFRPGGFRRRLEPEFPADILAVPLFIKSPRQSAPEVDDSNAQTIDILPTLAGIVGAEIPWPVDGRDLRHPDLSPPFKISALVGDSGKEVIRMRLPPRLELGESARRVADMFPHGNLWALGPRREVIGRELGEATPATTDFTWKLLDPWAFADIDPQSAFLPVQVRGTLKPETPGLPQLELAVAVNGVVRATTWTFEQSVGGRAFSVMIPEDAWTQGRNRIDVARIFRSGDHQTLLQAAQVSPEDESTFVLERHWFRDDSIVLPDGSKVTARPGTGLRGFVSVPPENVNLWGWAGDLSSLRPAERILVFEDDQLALAFDPRATWSGPKRSIQSPVPAFWTPVPGTLRYPPHSTRIRYFALLDGRAAELPYFVEPRELRDGRFEDRFGDPWLVISGKPVPVADGTLEGAITDRRRFGSQLTVSGFLTAEAASTGARIALLRADGSLAADLPLDEIAIRTDESTELQGAGRSYFQIRSRIEDEALTVRVLAHAPGIASELPPAADE